jgi:non-canonical purine NTP pyrophosphatase (RdgB/HAM1 family)
MSPTTFVTGNAGKFREAQAVVPTLVQLDLDLPEVQSLDPGEVIRAKLDAARLHVPDGLVVEDTSLSIDALGGLPGTLIKWFLDRLGTDGIAQLVDALGTGTGATARRVIGYLGPDSTVPVYYEHTLRGTITHPRGSGGFGWDALFVPEGSTKTLGEFTPEEKAVVSMRAAVFRKLSTLLSV